MKVHYGFQNWREACQSVRGTGRKQLKMGVVHGQATYGI